MIEIAIIAWLYAAGAWIFETASPLLWHHRARKLVVLLWPLVISVGVIVATWRALKGQRPPRSGLET